MGILYRKIEASDPLRRVYGWLPRMAHASKLQIGALMAESFCERTLRAAGHIISEGNTLLSDAEVEKLTILRMNREYMEYMRANYGHIVQQQFNKTVVDVEVDSSAPGVVDI